MSDIDRVLQELGFVAGDDGVLAAPESSRLTLAPVGQFYELRIHLLEGGNAIVAVISKSAIKVCREPTPSEAVDVEALISDPTRRRPW